MKSYVRVKPLTVRVWHLSYPDQGLAFFAGTVDEVYRRPCDRASCGHTLGDHGTPTGPLAAFRREQCHGCPCPGYRHDHELVAA